MILTSMIGNSDDKLTQAQWSQYVKLVNDSVTSEDFSKSLRAHFHGLSHGDAPWQNACWVVGLWFECDDNEPIKKTLLDELTSIRRLFNQDSVAGVAGEETLFV